VPIDIERFEDGDDFGDGRSHAVEILRFLARNDDKAFQRGEIADGTGIDPNVVSSVLSRLENRGLVRHKRPYWALGDRQRLADAGAFSQSLDALDARLGPEDMDEWVKAADAGEPGEPEREG
jgi:hypothetical protein